MRNYFLLFFLISFLAKAQTPIWNWAKLSKGLPSQNNTKTVTDSQGYIYTIGKFNDSLSFDNLPSITTPLQNNATSFFSKFDSLGNCLWLKKIEGNQGFTINSVVIDNNDNIILGCDSNSDTFLLNTITIDNSTTIIQIYGSNFFLAKFDSNGTFLWSKKQDIDFNKISAIDNLTIGLNNSIYASGTYYAAGMTIDSTILPTNSSGNANIFVAQFNSNGTVNWIKGFVDDTMYHETSDIHFFNNNLYLTGYFNSDITFETVEILLTNYSQFLLKLSPTGTPLTGYEIPFPDSNTMYTHKEFFEDHIYFYGAFDGLQLNVNGTVLNKIGYIDIFTAKYNLSGSLLWAKNFGYSGEGTLIQDITLDSNNNIYLAADTSSSNLTFGASTINNAGTTSTLIGKLNSNGIEVWGKNILNSTTNQYNYPQTITKINNLICVFGIYNYEQVNFDNNSLMFNPSPASTLQNYKIFYATIDENILKNEDFEKSSLLFPNPSKDYLYLNNTTFYMKPYKIIDISGKKIKVGSIEQNLKIDVSDLKNGLYILNIADEVNFKFFKN